MKALKDYTLMELINQISITGGINTDMESICTMQDIIGHSTIEEVKEAANSQHKESFYRLYGHCYGTVEAIKYYLKNDKSSLERKEYVESLEDTTEKESKRANDAEQRLYKLHESYMLEKAEAGQKIKQLEKQVEAQAEEIQKLKAKLYDLITA